MASTHTHTHTHTHTQTPFQDDFSFKQHVLDTSAVLGTVNTTKNVVSDPRDLHLVGEANI